MLTSAIILIPAAYMLINGVFALFGGKLKGMKMDGYTKESIQKFTRPCGAVMILMSLSLSIAGLGMNGTLPDKFTGIGFGALAVFIIIYVIIMKATLVKEN